MGQRLVITIDSKDGPLAKAYYHWSGYTHSGLAIANYAVQHFDSAIRTATSSIAMIRILNHDLTEDDLKYRTKIAIACNMLFATNAGLKKTIDTPSEDEAFQKMFPESNYMVGVNRSDGLIAITEKGMADLQMWSEADVVINIDTKSVDVSGLFFEYDPTNDDTSQIMELNQNLNDIPFDSIPEFTTNIINAIKNKTYSFMYNNNNMSVIM